MASRVSKGVPAARIPLATSLRPTRAAQVAEAQRLMSQLLPISVIRTKLMEKFNIGAPSVYKIIRIARELWAEDAEHDPAMLRREFVNAYKMFYNQAMAKEAYGPARQAIRDLTILEGVNPEVNARAAVGEALAEGVLQVDPEKVRARIAELAVKHAADKAGK